MSETWATELGCRLLLVLARISGLLAVVPAIGGRAVPQRIRVVFALALTLILAPTQLDHPVETAPALFVMLIFREALVGLALGLAARLVMMGAQLAGQWIGQVSGLAMSETLSPDADAEVSALSSLFHLLALAVFVTTGGHRQVVATLLDSFRWLPPGSPGLPHPLTYALCEVTAQSLRLSVRLAAPVLAALLSATLITGVIGRALPQVNALAVSTAGNALLTLAILAVGLGSLGWLLEEHLSAALQTIGQLGHEP